MMHIVLLILKIIGIILLVILGILLFLALSVLLVPIRYKVKGEWYKTAKAQARVHWLLHILSFRADYDQEGGLQMKLRLFGVPIWRTRREEPVEDGEHEAQHLGEEGEKVLSGELELDEKQYRESAEKKWGSENHSQTTGSEEKGGKDAGEAGSATFRGQRGEASGETSMIQKVMACIRRKLEKLRFSFLKICDKLKGIGVFPREKGEWLENEKNQASLRFLCKQAGRLLAHLWPGKGRGTFTFGFEDPYTTGQALQAASLIYPFCHRQLSIHPVFDRRILEGEGSFRGRIRLGFVLWLAVRIYFDKHTWKMVRGFVK